MLNKFYKFGVTLAFLPLYAMPASELNIIPSSTSPNPEVKQVQLEPTVEDMRAKRAAQIDKYYKERSMPLAGHGMTFVLAAEKYGLDWSLLPAIAVRESSGGKNDCYNNPFGWGSCKIKFSSYEEAIETLARNLGGANPRTSSYYAGTPTLKKLYYYNGTVIPSYPREVIKIMDRIEDVQVMDSELAMVGR